MESGRRRRSSSGSSSRSGESSGSRNGSGSSSRRRRSSSASGEGSSRRTDRSNFREDAGAGKKALYLVLTLGGIIALCVAFYVEFNPAGGAGDQAQAQAATPTPTPTPTPADGAAPAAPPKELGLTMEQYIDKLDSFGEHLQEQAAFSKSVVHEHVDWRCKVYSVDNDALVKSVLLLSAAAGEKEYHVNAFFNKPDGALINRLRLLQRGDIVRLTGAINEDDIRDIDADNLVLSN